MTFKVMDTLFECNLPSYLAHDLDAWKKGVEEHSHLLDCLWGELYGSINIAEINDGAITHEQAQYLRDKYLLRSANACPDAPTTARTARRLPYTTTATCGC